MPDIFGKGREPVRQQADAEKDDRYKQIGHLQVELDFLKKELALSIEDRRLWIDPEHSRLTIEQQCALLGLPRSTYYYPPRPESAENDRRLARSLIRFSERLGSPQDDGSIVMVPFTHGLLSQCVGTSREKVTHSMNQFRRQGYLRYARTGIILYRVAFKEWLRQNRQKKPRL